LAKTQPKLYSLIVGNLEKQVTFRASLDIFPGHFGHSSPPLVINEGIFAAGLVS